MDEHAPDAQPKEPIRRDPAQHERSPQHREPEQYTRPPSMSMTTRVVVGLIAFVPLALVALIVVRVATTPADPVAAAPAAEAGGAPLGAVLVLALLIFFFAAYVFNDRRLPTRSKGAWLAAFLLGGPITIPLYWYLHVLRAPRHGADA